MHAPVERAGAVSSRLQGRIEQVAVNFRGAPNRHHLHALQLTACECATYQFLRWNMLQAATIGGFDISLQLGDFAERSVSAPINDTIARG